MTETLYRCPACCRVAPWTDGQSREAGQDVDEFWCQACGAETPLAAMEVITAPLMLRFTCAEHDRPLNAAAALVGGAPSRLAALRWDREHEAWVPALEQFTCGGGSGCSARWRVVDVGPALTGPWTT